MFARRSMNTRFALIGAVLALCLAAAPRAQSQSVRGGVRTGATLAQVRGGTFSGPQVGAAATLFGRARLTERWALQPELRYVRKGGGGAEDNIEDTFLLGTFDATGAARLCVNEVAINGSVRADFLEGALLARYALADRDGWGAGLYAGPYAGVRIGRSAEADVSGRFTVNTENQEAPLFDQFIDDSVAGLVERADQRLAQAAPLLPDDAELPPIENPLASDDLFERLDYGLAVGGDVAVPLAGRRLLLGLWYELGLRDLLNQDSDAVQSAKQLLDTVDDFPEGGSGLEGRTSTLGIEVGVLL
jgi:hypothetical protein